MEVHRYPSGRYNSRLFHGRRAGVLGDMAPDGQRPPSALLGEQFTTEVDGNHCSPRTLRAPLCLAIGDGWSKTTASAAFHADAEMRCGGQLSKQRAKRRVHAARYKVEQPSDTRLRHRVRYGPGKNARSAPRAVERRAVDSSKVRGRTFSTPSLNATGSSTSSTAAPDSPTSGLCSAIHRRKTSTASLATARTPDGRSRTSACSCRCTSSCGSRRTRHQ